MQRRHKVFIIDHSPENIEMLQNMVEEEQDCEVSAALVVEPGNVQRIKDYSPDLVILDIAYEQGPDWQLLDMLRADEATSCIPVLAISTSEELIDRSLASFNVRNVLSKPFDTEQLNRAMRTIFSQPKVPVSPVMRRPGAGALMEAANILAVGARDVIMRWLQAVSLAEPFSSKQQLRPRQIISGTPVLLWGTIVALRSGVLEHLFEEQGTFHVAAVSHARLRQEQGVELAAVLSEYTLLRDSIWQMLTDKASKAKWTTEDAFRIGLVVHRALDEIVVIAARTYEQPGD